MMNRTFIGLIAVALSVFACSKKESNPDKIIAGEQSKIWKAVRETNSEGDKQKLTEADKQEVLQFYTNGTFSVNGQSSASQGKWDYEENGKNLSLTFADAGVSENFEVLTLEEEKIKLKAQDGSTMTLDADK